MKQGKVYLIGAGPGDPGLITVKGQRLLEQADVVVYDALVSEALLPEGQGRELIYVGKRGGEHAMEQGQINALLVEKAREGKTVARLKGGDPFVFGRGGEEAEYLAAHGIPFEIVPGVTSAIAAPAYAGIPVTDRRLASSVTFVTGQEDADKEEETIRWAELARGSDTLVFLMGRKNLAAIASRLMEGGLPGETQVALIRWGTTPQQQTIVGTLADIAEKAEAAKLTAPVIIVVGEVVRLRENLNWFETKPLFGKRIVVTRAELDAELDNELSALGAEVIRFPVIAFETIPIPPMTLAKIAGTQWDWAIYTSPRAVYFFPFSLSLVGAQLDCRVAAIGPDTAEAVSDVTGQKVDFVPSRYVAEKLLEEFPEPVTGKRILIPRAKEARDVLPKGLREMGAEVLVVPVYETVIPDTDPSELQRRLREGSIDLIIFTSSSTVRNFLKLAGAPPPEVKIASIGPVTSQTARKLGLRVDIEARKHSIEGLVEAIVEQERKERLA